MTLKDAYKALRTSSSDTLSVCSAVFVCFQGCWSISTPPVFTDPRVQGSHDVMRTERSSCTLTETDRPQL